MVKIKISMGIQERKDRERAEMRKKILDAAMNLFIDSGYEAVSIRNISDKIEYSPAAIYSYFEDKADILFELHNVGFSELYNLQMQVQAVPDPKDRLIAHGKAYLDFAFQNPQYYDLMFIMRIPQEKICLPAGWEHGERSYSLLVQNIIQCKEAGYFKDRDPLAVAYTLWSTVHGMASLFIRERLQFVTQGDTVVSDFVNTSAAIVRDLVN